MAGKAILANIKEWWEGAGGGWWHLDYRRIVYIILFFPLSFLQSQANVKELFPYVFFWNCMVSGLTFKWFERSNFILLHLDIYFSEIHLLKRLFPSLWIFWGLSQNIVDHICLGLIKDSILFLWSMFLMLIAYSFDYYSFVMQFEIGKCDASSLLFLLMSAWTTWWFVAPYKF